MCAVLVEAGFDVVASDERTDARADAATCGASWRVSPAEAAAVAEVLNTVLPGAAQVRTAMVGPAGALPALPTGATSIDMTSNGPQAVRTLCERGHWLAHVLFNSSGAWLDVWPAVS